jgi:hypothetical protein
VFSRFRGVEIASFLALLFAGVCWIGRGCTGIVVNIEVVSIDIARIGDSPRPDSWKAAG